jgi:phospholipase A1
VVSRIPLNRGGHEQVTRGTRARALPLVTAAGLFGRLTFLLCIAAYGNYATAAEDKPASSLPVAEATAESASSPESALDRRLAEEREAARQRFAITTHKPNYLLFTYNASANDRFEQLDAAEIKFQLSLKVSLAEDLLGGDIALAYTQVSFWQAFNSDISSPFRESNYEPEIMWRWVRPLRGDSLYNRAVVLGFVHQSNGRSEPLSRSWNRIYLNLIFEYQNLYVSVKPWYRIPEDPKTGPTDPSGDDNPDIADYMGYGEVTAVWVQGKHRVGLMLRNNLDSNSNHGAIQLDWSYPLGNKMQVYVQYFNGYGESLVDYNHSVNRIGAGLMLNNWL